MSAESAPGRPATPAPGPRRLTFLRDVTAGKGKLTLLHIHAVQPRKWWYLASLPSSPLQMVKVVVWDLASVPNSLLQMIKDGGGTWPSHLSNPAVREASS